MKPCVYLTINKQTGKWYVGSHKDSENIRNRTYMGSGTSIAPELESNPDDFTCEVLFEFVNRNDAFKAEHQILNKLDAAGDDNSYNNTNEAWPKEGFFKRLFSSKKGPLSGLQVQETVNKIKDSSSLIDEAKPNISFKEQMEMAAKAAYDSGLNLGMLYASTRAHDNEVAVFKIKLLNHIEGQIDLRDKDIRIIQSIEKTCKHVSPATLAKKVALKKDLEIFTKEKKKVQNDGGWFSIVSNSFTKGYNEGARIHINNILAKKGLSE